MYSPITAMDVTAKYAIRLFSAGRARMSEQVTHSQIELVGVPVRGLTFDHSLDPGSALSRLNAKDILEFAVTEAMPQKNCATAQITTRNSPVCRPAASMKIWAGGKPVALFRALS